MLLGLAGLLGAYLVTGWRRHIASARPFELGRVAVSRLVGRRVDCQAAVLGSLLVHGFDLLELQLELEFLSHWHLI